MMKKQSGITLIALVITVIILLIIVSIGVYEGKTAINNVNIQTLETNMLTIRAKAKSYGEELEAEIWDLSDTERTDKINELLSSYGMTEITIDSNISNQLSSEISSDYVAYEISEMLSNNGLSDLQEEVGDGQYIVIYNSSDYTQLDIAYTDGITYNDITYYTLSALQNRNSED